MRDVEPRLQQLLQQAIESSTAHGIQLQIDSPQLTLDWSSAVGFTDRSSNAEREALTPLHPLRIASVSKTFVAAAILRLWEQQHLLLDNSISNYICAEHSRLIKERGYALDRITIRHLLTHTSGLFDYADHPAFADVVANNPQQHWTRTAQLQLAMDVGAPYGKPGDIYRYSDTGYILLGEMIERVYGKSLGLALRELLHYGRLKLTSTYLEGMEEVPAGLPPQVHQYDNDLDSYAIDASADHYGGGGLVSTVGDMSRFMRALFTGGVYQSDSTLKEMLSSVDAKRGGSAAYGQFIQVPGEYRMGIEGGSQGVVFNHKGYLGTYAAFIPSLDMAIGLSVNQHGGEVRAQLVEAILAVFDIS